MKDLLKSIAITIVIISIMFGVAILFVVAGLNL